MNRLLFHEALKEAFGVFYNKEVAGRTTAELLATFFDNILKKGGSEKLSDEDTLEEVVKLLPYVSDQDLFAEFYRKKLARRLLFDKSANDEHERSILTKLKQKCGGQFTFKMEGMASALLLFNSSERLRYFEIKSQLNLTDEDVVRLLHSIACAKYKILTKEPNTKTVAQTDYFEFNPKFTNKMRRIEIPLPPVDEKKKVIEDVDRDRRYAIDASIIGIMKRRKVLSHHQLVMECVEQPGEMFKHSSKEITKGIEHLIAREFLERDKHNPNVLKYLP